MTRLFLVRHAPALNDGRLAGRRDVPADLSDAAGLARLAAALPRDIATLVSPALRCRQTAAALGRDDARPDPALWEQDFGAWEGLAPDALPDLGDLAPADLAAHRPPRGESFDDMAARVGAALRAVNEDAVIIAHAGTVRAGLALVTGPAAISFAVAPASLTILRSAGANWAVEAVNRLP